MKKFVFTLETLAKHKATVEKKQKAALSQALARLNALYAEQEHIYQAMRENAASQQQALEQPGELAEELKRHDNYQTYLRTWLEEVRRQIAQAEAEKKRIQALLTVTLKEIKTLKRLEEEQYQAYLAEARKEEDMEIGDMIAHSIKAVNSEQ